MHRQKLSVEDAGEGEGVEAVDEPLVGLLVALVQALRSEVEEVGHLTTLVVASKHADGFGVVDLQRETIKISKLIKF